MFKFNVTQVFNEICNQPHCYDAMMLKGTTRARSPGLSVPRNEWLCNWRWRNMFFKLGDHWLGDST